MRRLVCTVVMAMAALLSLAGCATQGSSSQNDPELRTMDLANLPPANIDLNIASLGPCTDNPDRTLHLNAQQPVTVMVHGCFGSSGLFRGLAQVFAFHGQQSACFAYNDRDSLMRSSAQLATALDQLAQHMDNKHVTVIGHSQGGLIARKALVADRPDAISNPDLQLRLVTVSGPFSGIAAANHCGNPALRTLSLGLVSVICQLVTGDKWSEISYSSEFILQPGALHQQVHDYLKVVSDERGSCRQFVDGKCVKSDSIFSLQEQSNPIVDGDPITKIAQVKAGHVEIIGDKRVAPLKLIAILQQNGILNATEPQRAASLNLLLAGIYGEAY